MVGAIAVFRGIPYAAPPIGELRFRSPEPLPRWSEIRDATHDGPIAPQLPSRLARVTGDCNLPQSEDCLTLNIWTPALESGPAPVLVWLHGGGFIGGSGQFPGYSGQDLAERGDVVVVTVSSRLGALGFLYLPGLADGNMGLLDQQEALRWISANIRRFGGDPKRVTICGQSSGGRSVLAHMGCESAPVFQRAILMSAPFGHTPLSPDVAAQNGHAFLDLLGLTSQEAKGLRAVPVERLLANTQALARRQSQLGQARRPFDTVADGKLVHKNPGAAALDGPGLDIDVLVGTTRDEAAAHLVFDAEAEQTGPQQVQRVAEEWLGDAGGAYLTELKRQWPYATPYTLLVHLTTDRVFLRGAVELAEERARRDRPVHLYRFDWQSPTPRIGACHCIELPFLFNTFDDWPGAAMLAGGDRETMEALARTMQDAFIAFVHTGSPNGDKILPWSAYTAPTRTTMRFDTMVEPVGDLAGVGWRASWGVD